MVATPSTVAAADGKGVLRIEGSSDGESWIYLDNPSKVSIDGAMRSDQIKVAGRGRVVGVVLERVGAGPDAVLIALNYNACGTRACEPLQVSEYVDGTQATTTAEDGSRTVRLPAGRYRVVLVADGAPRYGPPLPRRVGDLYLASPKW